MPKLDVWQPKSNADAVAESRGRSRSIPRRRCKNLSLRKKLEADPPEWLKYFFPARFSLPWASYHLDIIHDSLYAIRHGTNQLNIAPRGGGKSRPVMGVILLAGLSGISPFPVYAPWKSEAVDQAFRFWIAALAHNKRLADLYPEFCDPFRVAKGAPQRMSSLVWDDKDKDPTGARLAVSDGLIILPDSRGIIGSTTINGNPLGMAYDAPNGTTIRPTIVFIDDPEDDKVAESETLTKKIIQEELPSILLKSLNTYFGLVDMHRASEFTTWCPPYFRETGTLLHDNNYMYKFLTAGPDDNKSSTHRYYIVHKPGAFANLADVKKMFENYMRFNHRGTNWKWTSDYTPFKQLGFSVIYQNMCKSCGKGGKSGCCDQSHPSNRTKRYIVQDMEIIKQSIPSSLVQQDVAETTYSDDE